MRRLELADVPGLGHPAPPGGEQVSRRPDLDALLRAVPVSRMIDYGLPAADAGHLTEAVASGAEWVTTGLAVADRHRRDSAAAADAGLAATDRYHRYAAAIAALIAQLGFDDDSPDRKAVYADAIDDFARAGGDGRWERMDVEAAGRVLVSWSQLPAGAPPPAIILIWGGTSGWGPVYRTMAAPLVARGLGVALVELPGQGQPRLQNGCALDGDFVGIVSELLDRLTVRVGVAVRFAVIGNSMGGLLAARVAAALPRVGACVINGGVARPMELVRRYPRQRRQWQLMVGAHSEAELSGALDTLSLDPHTHRLDCAVLIFHGGADPLVTGADVDAFWTAASVKRDDLDLLVHAPDGEHCFYNRAGERNAILADWLTAAVGHVGGGRPACA